jgi:MarR family transcriptional regulator, 2-MHQ and catechol-resistance regulon repressor
VQNEPISVDPRFTDEFPGADPVATEAGANLVRTSSMLLAEIARRRREVADLSASAFEVLAVLEGAGEPLPSSVIAERLLVSTASMTSLLDTLERRGLVARRPHPQDRRKILVELTEAAYDVVDRMLPLVHAAMTDAFDGLTEAQRHTLVELLGHVQARLTDLSGRTPAAPLPRNPPRVRRARG